jgi:hypothetical protein
LAWNQEDMSERKDMSYPLIFVLVG